MVHANHLHRRSDWTIRASDDDVRRLGCAEHRHQYHGGGGGGRDRAGEVWGRGGRKNPRFMFLLRTIPGRQSRRFKWIKQTAFQKSSRDKFVVITASHIYIYTRDVTRY